MFVLTTAAASHQQRRKKSWFCFLSSKKAYSITKTGSRVSLLSLTTSIPRSRPWSGMLIIMKVTLLSGVVFKPLMVDLAVTAASYWSNEKERVKLALRLNQLQRLSVNCCIIYCGLDTSYFNDLVLETPWLLPTFFEASQRIRRASKKALDWYMGYHLW